MTPVTTRRNQYALRAIFELAKRSGLGPTKIAHIAQAQGIPVRFLEVILNRLKRSGLVDARRGASGGYFLTRSAGRITVADIMTFMHGPSKPSQCAACVAKTKCPHGNRCAFSGMWNRVSQAVLQVYTQTTIQDLLDNDRQRHGKRPSLSTRSHQMRQGRLL